MNEIVDFMLHSFGLQLTRQQKQITSNAAIILFSAMEYKLGTDRTVRFVVMLYGYKTKYDFFSAFVHVPEWLVCYAIEVFEATSKLATN